MAEAISKEAVSAPEGAAATVPPDTAAVLDNNATSLIKNYVMAAGAASLMPLPLFDVAAITAVQMRMIQKISALYGKTFSEKAARNALAALGGAVVGHGGGVLAAISLTKFLPGVGSMLGMVSLPVVAGASTYAIGRVFVRHFAQGGTMGDISAEKVRGDYKEQFETGKSVAVSLKQKAKRTAPREQPA